MGLGILSAAQKQFASADHRVSGSQVSIYR